MPSTTSTLPATASSSSPTDFYTCHEQHAAVDTTFVQFYPTLLEVAKQKHTLSPLYLKEPDAPR